MITNHDRSGWFGASDAHFIVGNYDTETFKKWWLEKLGLRTNLINTKAMRAGTHYEHKILKTVPGVVMDRQILIPELHLRVNLDGETSIIYECKTHKDEVFKASKANIQQVNVQMFAANKQAEIIAYRMLEADYANYFNPIDENRISHYPVIYDKDFIALWLHKIEYLGSCLERGAMPK